MLVIGAAIYLEDSTKSLNIMLMTQLMESMELRSIEQAKIHCAKEHFKAISGENVFYDVVDSYQALMDKVMK